MLLLCSLHSCAYVQISLQNGQTGVCVCLWLFQVFVAPVL